MGWLVELVVVAFAVLLMIVQTEWFAERVRREAEHALRDQFPGGARIGRIELALDGRATLSKVEIAALDGRRAVAFERLRIQIAILPLFAKLVRVERLVVDDLHVVLGHGPLQKPEPPRSEPASSDPPTWSVKLPVIEVHRAVVEIEGKRPVALDGIEVTANATLLAGQPIVAEATVRGRWRERQAPFELAGKVSLGDVPKLVSATVNVGGAKLVAKDLVIDLERPEGALAIDAPAAAVTALVPGVELPADAHVQVVADKTHFVVSGSLGVAKLHGMLNADVRTREVGGVIGVTGADFATLTRGKLVGRGDAIAALTVDRRTASGLVGFTGELEGYSGLDVAIGIDATRERAKSIAVVRGAGDLRAVAASTIERAGTELVLDGRVTGGVRDAALLTAAATRDQTIVSGAFTFDVKAKGELRPTLDVALSGTLDGRRLRMEDLAASRLAGTLREGRIAREGARVAFHGRMHADVTGITSAGTPVGALRLDARTERGGTLWADARLVPVVKGFVIDASGRVTPGSVTTTIAVHDHRVQTPKGLWAGKGGRVTITDERISVREIVTARGDGSLAITSDHYPLTEVMTATVEAKAIPAALVDSTYRGLASGRVAVERRGLRWKGGGKLELAGFALEPGGPIVSGDATVAVAGRRVTVDASATSAGIGRVGIALDVDGPRDITDPLAWQRLDGRAVRVAKITLGDPAHPLELATVSPFGGTVSGQLELAGANGLGGKILVRDVMSPIGRVTGDVDFAPLPGGEIGASTIAQVDGVGDGRVDARITLPQRPFDPAAWTRLGRGVAKSVTAEFDGITVGPALLAKLGVDAPYRGRADVALEVGTGATTAELEVMLHDVTGGVLKRPLDLKLTASSSAASTLANACIAHAASPGVRGGACVDGGLAGAVAEKPVPIAELAASVPVAFERWLTAPKTTLAARLTGTLAIPSQDAPQLLAAFGRADFERKPASKLDGSFAIAGTLGDPAVTGKLTARELQLVPKISRRTVPALQLLTVAGSWRGGAATIDLDARESSGGKLELDAVARPDRLADLSATAKFTALDLAPLTALLPDTLTSAAGKLDGKLTMRGIDPTTGTLRGRITLRDGQLPLTPQIGTLREIDATITLANTGIDARVDGRLGIKKTKNAPRNISLRATAASDLSTVEAKLDLQKVSPIGAFEPIIDAFVEARLRQVGTQWTGGITISRGRVTIPPSSQSELFDADKPADLYFVDVPPVKKLAGSRVPVKPWLVASVDLGSTTFAAEDVDARGSIRSRNLRLSIGDAVGLTGEILVERGNIELIGRNYRIQPGEAAKFDGSLDPNLSIQVTHTFRSGTSLTAIVGGRLSNWNYRFVTDPPGYTDGQMLGFFLGDEPGGEAGSSTRAAAAGVGSSILSREVNRRLKKVLPKQLQVDLFKCEPGSSTSSASCTLGKWVYDTIFVGYRQRVQPRVDENSGDALLQWYFAREWILEGSGGDGGHNGVDVLWRRRW